MSSFRAWLVVLFVALPACGGIFDAPPSNVCESNDDCSSGVCDAELGMCIGTITTNVTFALEVAPAVDAYGDPTTIQPITFAPFDLEGPTRQNLALPSVIPTQGAVRDGETGELVSAEIQLTLVGRIPGGPSTRVLAEASSSFRTAPDLYEFNFSAEILPDQEYTVVAHPTGDWRSTRPPLRFASRYLSPSSGIARIDFLEYPAFCTDPLTATEPCLATIEGFLRDGDETPQDGYVVKAIDRETGATISSRYVTGSDSEAETGFFRVVFDLARWQDPGSWFLQVSPSTERIGEYGPAPTFSVAPSALLEVDGMVTVRVADYAALALTYSGVVETVDRRPVANASVRFTSTDVVDPSTGITGSYTVTVLTEEDGSFTDVPLLGTIEGVEAGLNYEIVITPSQVDVDLSVLREEVELGASGSGQLFQVALRARFGGTVRTVDGLGMIDARVASRPRGGDRDGTLDPVAFFARSSNTTTDPDGLFDLPLDIGFYDVVIEPPMGTGFPWQLVPDVAIGGGTGATSFYDLEHPVPVTGEVTWLVEDGDGNAVPVAGGEVRAYAIVEDDTGVRAIQIGRATTDETGAYTLLLPPSF